MTAATPPRLLKFQTEVQARLELRRIGAQPCDRFVSHMMAGCEVFKLHQVPHALVVRLKHHISTLPLQIVASQQLLMEAGSTGDLLLCGPRSGLRQLCRRLHEGDELQVQAALSLDTLLAHLEHPPAYLRGRTCTIDLSRPRIMGILNVTPDSFSDGGRFIDPKAALEQARSMVEQGAALIDVGGESTRPGAASVDEAEELQRVVPVIEQIAAHCDVPVSVDTTKSRVAREAVQAGAEFVNDVSALRFDPDMARVAAESGAGLFLMHTRGRSDIMQKQTHYSDLIGDICRYLAQGVELACSAGIELDRIAVDPGIGFGKDVAGNLEILRRLAEFQALGRPVLLGTSRKSFLGKILDRPQTSERLHGTLTTVALGVAQGARLFRVHDVAPNRDAALTAWSIHPYM